MCVWGKAGEVFLEMSSKLPLCILCDASAPAGGSPLSVGVLNI